MRWQTLKGKDLQKEMLRKQQAKLHLRCDLRKQLLKALKRHLKQRLGRVHQRHKVQSRLSFSPLCFSSRVLPSLSV